MGNWRAVPDAAMRAVPTRRAEVEVTEDYISNLSEQHQTVTFLAKDEILNSSGTWSPANTRVSQALNITVLEPQSLTLYVGTIVRMTYKTLSDIFFVSTWQQV